MKGSIVPKEAGAPEGEFLVQQIIRYNVNFVPRTPEDYNRPMNYIVEEDGEIVAGIKAFFYGTSTTHVDVLWISEAYRKCGYGSILLKKIEEETRKLGGTLVHLETYDFQARAFYEKHGYEVFGTLDGCPDKGRTKFFLRKYL